jgi:hypothetical protein
MYRIPYNRDDCSASRCSSYFGAVGSQVGTVNLMIKRKMGDEVYGGSEAAPRQKT